MWNNLEFIKKKSDGSGYTITCEICGKEDDILYRIFNGVDIHFLCTEHHKTFLRKEKIKKINLVHER